MNTFPRQRIRKYVLSGYNNETVFSVGSAPKLYNEDPRPAEELIESLEMAVR
jgi:hypothetical protein